MREVQSILSGPHRSVMYSAYFVKIQSQRSWSNYPAIFRSSGSHFERPFDVHNEREKQPAPSRGLFLVNGRLASSGTSTAAISGTAT